MSRTRASAKAAGTRTETAAVAFLAAHVDDRIERRRQSGAKDRGDVSGLRVNGQRVVVEVKDCSRLELGSWLTEAEVERGNDDAIAACVIAKRRGKGDPGDLLVAMTLRDLVAILSGTRPEPIAHDADSRPLSATGTAQDPVSGVQVPPGRQNGSQGRGNQRSA